jgi:hypothetical protein
MMAVRQLICRVNLEAVVLRRDDGGAVVAIRQPRGEDSLAFGTPE